MPAVRAASPRSLTSFSLDELSTLLESRTRALALLKWLYASAPGETKLPDEVPGVASAAWRRLRPQVSMPRLALRERAASPDGTVKYVFDFDGALAESVLIPSRGRSTVCVSSQAGCTRRCAFCATATLGFTRSLSAGEILAQYRRARADAPPDAPARNVVFMGMGEPMDNLEEVLRAVELLTQPPAPQLGAEQVTVSTSGVLPGMKRFLRESKASLALSLNASTDAQREVLMPQNKVWPIQELLAALREDAVAHPRRVHFIEYVLFDGVNDQRADADRVVALLHGMNVRLNLIPHNPFGASPLRPPSAQRVLEFQARSHASGLRCFIRWPRGREIAAACGQLALNAAPASF